MSGRVREVPDPLLDAPVRYEHNVLVRDEVTVAVPTCQESRERRPLGLG